jgi:hypothetical protein
MSAAARSHDCDPRVVERSHSCDLLLQDLKDAMRETGWTAETLARHYGVHRSYMERCLAAVKPLTADRLANLPPDVAAKFDAKRAERRGLIVVQPLAGLDAQKAVVAGLLGLMAQRFPAKHDHMAHADLPVRSTRAVNE